MANKKSNKKPSRAARVPPTRLTRYWGGDPDEWDDLEQPESTEPIRKPDDEEPPPPPSAKQLERRQRSREIGRALKRFKHDRKRLGDDKP
jgi:hypothetical protein